MICIVLLNIALPDRNAPEKVAEFHWFYKGSAQLGFSRVRPQNIAADNAFPLLLEVAFSTERTQIDLDNLFKAKKVTFRGKSHSDAQSSF